MKKLTPQIDAELLCDVVIVFFYLIHFDHLVCFYVLYLF